MNDVQLTDLKHFLTGKFLLIDQRFDGIDKRLDKVESRLDKVELRLDGIDSRFDGIDARLDGIEREMRDGFAGVADVIETSNQLFERRLTRLEHQTGIL